MKFRTLFFILAILTIARVHAFAEVPHGIAGFVLGKDIAGYQDRLRMDTVLPIRHAEFLKEVETRRIPGYKSGLIVFGDCARTSGRIIRIKMKYADPSEEFYEKLLEKFKQRFGKPDRWRGDPFHVVISWKWSFSDEQGNRIGLTLQHNTKDSSEKLGNVVKLVMYNLEEDELECFEREHPRQSRPDTEHVEKIENPGNWDVFLPE